MIYFKPFFFCLWWTDSTVTLNLQMHVDMYICAFSYNCKHVSDVHKIQEIK